MAAFSFHNERDEGIDLLIEPFALWVRVEPGQSADFEVEDSPPPDIEFATTASGNPYIYVMSERVEIRVGGKRHEFKTRERPKSSPKLLRVMQPSWASAPNQTVPASERGAALKGFLGIMGRKGN